MAVVKRVQMRTRVLQLMSGHVQSTAGRGRDSGGHETLGERGWLDVC